MLFRSPEAIKDKLAMFCNVRKESVIQNKTADCLYAVPLMLEEEGLATEVCKHLKLDKLEVDNTEWEKMVDTIRNRSEEKVKIAIVGKYIQLEDSYLSVAESVQHGSFANDVKVDIVFIDSETINNNNVKEKLKRHKWKKKREIQTCLVMCHAKPCDNSLGVC